MKYGLSDKQLNEVIAILKNYPEINEAILFGSRAIDSYKEASDVDIALKGEEVTVSFAATLKAYLEEETYLPFFFDFIAYPTIDNDALLKHINSKGVTIYRVGWEEVVLSEVIDLIGGGTPKTSVVEYWGGDIPWLSVADFNSCRKYVYGTEKTISPLGLKNSSTKLLKKGDIIISARGTIGAMAMLGSAMTFNQSCYGVRAKANEALNEYIFYLLKEAVSNLQQISHGGVFDTITRDTFKEIKIKLPSLPEQKAIASVLSSLDDKIDLLHRQNKTLEAMAETLFRKWFVEEVQDEWEEGDLGCFAENPKTSVQPKDIDVDTKYIGLEHISKKSIALLYHERNGVIASNKYQFVENDILFGKLRPYFHKVCFAPYNGVCSTDILVIRPKHIHYFSYCLFAFFQEDVVEYANLGSEGTRMPRTNWKMLSQYPVKIPDEETLSIFNDLVTPSVEKIKQNQNQIKTLEKLRDTLLPKLISGEVRVAV